MLSPYAGSPYAGSPYAGSYSGSYSGFLHDVGEIDAAAQSAIHARGNDPDESLPVTAKQVLLSCRIALADTNQQLFGGCLWGFHVRKLSGGDHGRVRA